MHRAFTTEVERRVLGRRLQLSPNQRAMLWRSQVAVWMEQEPHLPAELQPLVREGAEMLKQLAFLVEAGLERSLAFAQVSERLLGLSDRIVEWDA